jgi:hypothetical protein
VGLVTKNFSDIITFSRGTNATYTDSTGTLQYAEANMLLYSEQFDDPSWTKNNVTVSPNVTTAPDGTLTADKLVESATTSQHILQQVNTRVASLSYTYSVYAKIAEWTSFQLQLGSGGPIGTFNLVAQTASFGTGATAATIQDVGAGWFRCTVTGPANASSFTYIYKNATSYLGDGVSGIYIWGAQLNPGALQTYIATTATAYYGPRFDYNPATLAPLGFLVEEARTNSIRNNTGVGAVVGSPGTLPTGVAVFSANGLTTAVSAVGTTAGINYVDLRFSGTTTSTFYVLSFDNVAATASSGQVWTETFWCALVGGSTTNVSSFVVDLRQVGGAGGTFDVVFTPTTTLNRVASSGTMLVGATGAYGAFVMTFASGVAIDVTLRFGLPQLELGAFATSVIPTASVATTRSADVAVINTLSPWYNQTEGTVFVTASSFGTANGLTHALSNNTFNESIYGNFVSSTSYRGANVLVGGVNQTGTIATFGGLTPSVVIKDALAYKTADFAESLDGRTARTDTSGTVPTVDRMYLGSNWTGNGNFLNGYIQQITYYPRRLSDVELQTITT